MIVHCVGNDFAVIALPVVLDTIYINCDPPRGSKAATHQSALGHKSDWQVPLCHDPIADCPIGCLLTKRTATSYRRHSVHNFMELCQDAVPHLWNCARAESSTACLLHSDPSHSPSPTNASRVGPCSVTYICAHRNGEFSSSTRLHIF